MKQIVKVGNSMQSAFEHEYVLDRVASGHGAVHHGLQRNGLAAAQQLVRRDHNNGVARVNALAKRLRGETLHKTAPTNQHKASSQVGEAELVYASVSLRLGFVLVLLFARVSN